jgi:superfamily II DNA/RNA helicase
VLKIKRATYVVVDKHNHMFDMDFEPQVMKILANVRPDGQTILFLATFPKNMAAVSVRPHEKLERTHVLNRGQRVYKGVE